jgi:AcrR family transcriptional regulator
MGSGSLDGVSSREPLIRPPLQRRSQESLERVLRAGLELLQEAGFEGFTVQEVSRRSGVSIGSIYSRAPSRQALILAIHDRVAEQMAVRQEGIRKTAERTDLSTGELVERLVTDMAALLLDNAASLRVFIQRAPVDAEFWRRGAERSRELAQIFETALLDHRGEIRHPDPELAIDIAFRFVYLPIMHRIAYGPEFESEREVSDGEFVRELARAAADYLLGPRTP